MEVHLTPDQEVFIQQRVRDGRFATADEAVQLAVSLLREREGDSGRDKVSGRKSLAKLFAESPFRGLDMEFHRDKDPLRPLDI